MIGGDMTSLSETHMFDVMQQPNEDEHFSTLYPDPSHVDFLPGYPMDVETCPPSYSGYVPASRDGLMNNGLGSHTGLFVKAPQTTSLSHRRSPGRSPDERQIPSPNTSSASGASESSSAVGSPRVFQHHAGAQEWGTNGLTMHPSIVGNDYVVGMDYTSFVAPMMEEMAYDLGPHPKGFLDPSMINTEMNMQISMPPPYESHFQHQSPAYSSTGSSTSPRANTFRTSSSSPFQHSTFRTSFPNSPYTTVGDLSSRRPSMATFTSPGSGEYASSDDVRDKHRCTCPDCGKVFKDLKAHLLTHQTSRPEKCPITSCEYHIKGFARKYDKNRHTLTHYKGNMVCGFCSGAGSAREKSFNRADVFKRHLMSVHGVEQTPPNSRKRSATTMTTGNQPNGYPPDATGKCSTCSQTFANAQDFYEHLDDCVLRIVQQEDPAEAINAQRLAEVENDADLHETLERHDLPKDPLADVSSVETKEEDDGSDSEDLAKEVGSARLGSTLPSKTGPANGIQKSKGLTHSRHGVKLNHKKKSRKNNEDNPKAWGIDADHLVWKKRVICTFDGPRRLHKDELVLHADTEVRATTLSDGKSYVTDLDYYTQLRAQGMLDATEEEKGPWISDDPTEEDHAEMQRRQQETADEIRETFDSGLQPVTAE